MYLNLLGMHCNYSTYRLQEIRALQPCAGHRPDILHQTLPKNQINRQKICFLSHCLSIAILNAHVQFLINWATNQGENGCRQTDGIHCIEG